MVGNVKNRSDDGFDVDEGERKVQISSGLGNAEQDLWWGVSVRNEGEKEGRKGENVEGLVHKSKRFLPMNLSNPKGASFGVEEEK